MTTSTQPLVNASGIAHVRLTVTDIARSKAFYRTLFGMDPAIDMSDKVGEPGVTEDPKQIYGGCVFGFGDQLLGLRPVAASGDSFQSTRVGLDHVSLAVASVDELRAAAQRLSDAGVDHGEVIELTDMGVAILSVQDPDDINLEFTAAI